MDHITKKSLLRKQPSELLYKKAVFKGTLMQIWKSVNIFIFTWK